MQQNQRNSSHHLWAIALWLTMVTIVYNVGEGVVSIIFGYSDETLSLFGFGLDSLVEVVSGIGVWRMIGRIRSNSGMRDAFEKTALRITGGAFYVLTASLVVTAIFNVVSKKTPDTTFWGIVISLISIAAMTILMQAKLKVGKQLGSDALIADAHCTGTCIMLSFVLLAASLLFALLKIGFIDSIGALGIAYFAFREGREAFEKAKGKVCNCAP